MKNFYFKNCVFLKKFIFEKNPDEDLNSNSGIDFGKMESEKKQNADFSPDFHNLFDEFISDKTPQQKKILLAKNDWSYKIDSTNFSISNWENAKNEKFKKQIDAAILEKLAENAAKLSAKLIAKILFSQNLNSKQKVAFFTELIKKAETGKIKIENSESLQEFVEKKDLIGTTISIATRTGINVANRNKKIMELMIAQKITKKELQQIKKKLGNSENITFKTILAWKIEIFKEIEKDKKYYKNNGSAIKANREWFKNYWKKYEKIF